MQLQKKKVSYPRMSQITTVQSDKTKGLSTKEVARALNARTVQHVLGIFTRIIEDDIFLVFIPAQPPVFFFINGERIPGLFFLP